MNFKLSTLRRWVVAVFVVTLAALLLRQAQCKATPPDYGVWGPEVGETFMEFQVPATVDRDGRSTVSLAGPPIYNSAADLPYGVFLEGKITDEHGEPLLGVEVEGSCELRGGAMFETTFSQRYIADGTYRMALPRIGLARMYFSKEGRRSVQKAVSVDAFLGSLESEGRRGLPVEWKGASAALLNDGKVLSIQMDVVLKIPLDGSTYPKVKQIKWDGDRIGFEALWNSTTIGQGATFVLWNPPLPSEPAKAIKLLKFAAGGRDLNGQNLEESGCATWESPEALIFVALKTQAGRMARGKTVSPYGSPVSSDDLARPEYQIGPDTVPFLIYNQAVLNEGFAPLFVQDQLNDDLIAPIDGIILLPETGYQPEIEISDQILEFNLDDIVNLKEGHYSRRKNGVQYVAFHIRGVYGLAVLDQGSGQHLRYSNDARDSFSFRIRYYVPSDLGRTIRR